jgi:hypothetical protein
MLALAGAENVKTEEEMIDLRQNSYSYFRGALMGAMNSSDFFLTKSRLRDVRYAR